MKDRSFLDTNIFVYSFYSTDPRKRNRTKNLISSALKSGNGVISFQVIQEFVNVSTRKFEIPLSINEVRHYYKNFLKPLLNVYPTEELYEEAFKVFSETNYSFYDSLIIAAAIQSKASILYSEDLQHQDKVRKLKIIDPFK